MPGVVDGVVVVVDEPDGGLGFSPGGVGWIGRPQALEPSLCRRGLLVGQQGRDDVIDVAAHHRPIARDRGKEAEPRVGLRTLAGHPDRTHIQDRVADRDQLDGATLDLRSRLAEQRELAADELVGLDRGRGLRRRGRRRIGHCIHDEMAVVVAVGARKDE